MSATLIHQRFNQAAANGLNFAAIKLPQQTAIHYLYSKEAPTMAAVQFVTDAKVQFVCSPYGAADMAYTLVPELYLINDQVQFGKPLPPINHPANFDLPVTIQNHFASQANYIRYVENGVANIRSHKLRKIVAARCAQTQLPTSFNIAHYFELLTTKYPDACVYFFHFANGPTWCGATPEKLITIENGLLETVALAGTQPIGNNALWTAKEREEHALTELFIADTFAQLKAKNYQKSEVETVVAGAIQHLKSSFTFKAKSDWFAQRMGKLLALLNPTPAVCGLPQHEASLFIAQNEQLERRFYAGFVGLQRQQQTHLFVNLRCMELAQTNALLYAGAGITANSDAAAEWNETERKMQTLLSALAAL